MRKRIIFRLLAYLLGGAVLWGVGVRMVRHEHFLLWLDTETTLATHAANQDWAFFVRALRSPVLPRKTKGEVLNALAEAEPWKFPVELSMKEIHVLSSRFGDSVTLKSFIRLYPGRTNGELNPELASLALDPDREDIRLTALWRLQQTFHPQNPQEEHELREIQRRYRLLELGYPQEVVWRHQPQNPTEARKVFACALVHLHQKHARGPCSISVEGAAPDQALVHALNERGVRLCPETECTPRFSIEWLSWTGDDTVDVAAEYYVGPLYAAGVVCHLVRKAGEWRVIRTTSLWVS
ncbi:MAG: hypothetical protein ACOCUY_01480 [Verrucomicrobiota bacterium]